MTGAPAANSACWAPYRTLTLYVMRATRIREEAGLGSSSDKIEDLVLSSFKVSF